MKKNEPNENGWIQESHLGKPMLAFNSEKVYFSPYLELNDSLVAHLREMIETYNLGFSVNTCGKVLCFEYKHRKMYVNEGKALCFSR